MKKWNLLATVLVLLCMPTMGRAGILFEEKFDDADLSSRGWYDPQGSGSTISTSEHSAGSTGSFECNFSTGATGCSGGAPRRHAISPTDRVYISFWVKHSSNWAGSGRNYHPHIIYLLTNQNGAWDGLSYDHLTAYLEENEGYPAMAIQDGQNIDESQIGANLIGTTENRSVAGCNGTAPNMGQHKVDCYQSGSVHWNDTNWRADTAYYFDPAQKTNWHFVEAYYQLNTVANGIGQQDGILRYWYDGKLVIERTNIIMRTGKYPNMLFNQFVLAPWIGDGSPADQTFWIDELSVGTSRPAAGTTPSAPTNLTIQ